MLTASFNDFFTVEHVGSNLPDFPTHWHSTERWATAFTHLEPALAALADLIICFREVPQVMFPGNRRHTAVAPRRWVLDCLCWLQCFLACVGRDGWVHPSNATKSCAGNKGSRLSGPVTSDIDIARFIRRSLGQQQLPIAVVQRCFKFLRSSSPSPPSTMSHQGRQLSIAETHKGWCEKLRLQCQGPQLSDLTQFNSKVRDVSSLLGRVWKSRGTGQLDKEITQPDVLAVISAWKASKAMPPDLIPRAAFLCGQVQWLLVVWLLVQLAGPSRWALRPGLWRWACLGTVYKTGKLSDFGSWRLLFIKSQMGLLQEGVLANGVRPSIWGYLFDGQSGYMRSTDDPLLALTELTTSTISDKKCFFALLGDFQKAFPFTWREDILLLAANCPNLTGGQLHLLGDMLSLDVVLVRLGGESPVIVKQGLPEGGCLGPLLYPLLPDSLIRVLWNHRCGLGFGLPLPDVWKEHTWSGQGVPQDEWTAKILADTDLTVQRLPVSAALRGNKNLEASAARALDLMSPARVCALLHADDPVFLASSWGEMCRMIFILERWAPEHGACFHIGEDKTVLFRIGGFGPIPPVFLRPSFSSIPMQVSLCTSSHRWLGWIWDATGGAEATLKRRTITASAHFATLAGLCLANAVPLPLALCLFESKIEGSLVPGRWLYAVLAPNAQEVLDELYFRWARVLLGVPPWKPAHLACLELGGQVFVEPSWMWPANVPASSLGLSEIFLW